MVYQEVTEAEMADLLAQVALIFGVREFWTKDSKPHPTFISIIEGLSVCVKTRIFGLLTKERYKILYDTIYKNYTGMGFEEIEKRTAECKEYTPYFEFVHALSVMLIEGCQNAFRYPSHTKNWQLWVDALEHMVLMWKAACSKKKEEMNEQMKIILELKGLPEDIVMQKSEFEEITQNEKNKWTVF